MKVLLPSRGLFGQYKVEMRIPTMGDLYDIQSYNKDDLLKKYHFLTMISNVELSKVTAYDAEYLYMLAAFSLLFNEATYTHKCPKCGNTVKKVVRLSELDIVQLKAKPKDFPLSKRVSGNKYMFNLLSAAQMLEAYEQAQYEDNSEQAFEDLKVTFIMGKPHDIKYVRSLPISVYLSALMFQRINYHGLDNLVEAKCPKCGRKIKFRFALNSSVLDTGNNAIVRRFASVSGLLSFEDFLKMSLIDFSVFVSERNKLM